MFYFADKVRILYVWNNYVIGYCGKSVLTSGLQFSYCGAFCCAVVTDPLGDVLSFIEQFEQLYGSSHPEIYRGTYSQVSLYPQVVIR